MDRFSDMQQQILISFMETVLVVFTISGTFFVLEALGDFEGFYDKFVNSGMGAISFFQMVYFTFITISTVGYGDYSPTTVASRIFSVVAIFAGVGFFSYLSVRLMEIAKLEASGQGKYRPLMVPRDASGRGHILIIGGGLASGSVTVLETFLRAMCRHDTPDIVMLSQAQCSDPVRKLLKENWARWPQQRIKYFVGDPHDPKALARVRAGDASMTFVLSNFDTDNSVAEDQANLLIAATLQRQYPSSQFRVMLVRMPSLVVSSQIGLSEFNCFSIEAFKAALLGTSARCPGFSTLVLNMSLPDPEDPDETMGLRSFGEALSPWLSEYNRGCMVEAYGFLPHPRYHGQTFQAMAVAMARDAGRLPIAAQFDGAIRVNPSALVVTKETVVFGLARSAAELAPLVEDVPKKRPGLVGGVRH